VINTQTLDAVIKILKSNRIICGIGGSYLLQVYQLYEDPEDVDFWVAPEDIDKVRQLFSQYEELENKIQLPPKYHFKMKYEDIVVDFVACFITKPNKNEFIYNILPENIEYIETDNGIRLPCTSLEDWYIVYKLLNREEKAELIRRYIYKNDVESTNTKLDSFINDGNNKLPQRVIRAVKDFIWDNNQIDFFTEIENKQ